MYVTADRALPAAEIGAPKTGATGSDPAGIGTAGISTTGIGTTGISATGISAADSALRDRLEIVDALYRFGLGQDLADRALFASAFADSAELDFRPAARRWGADVPVMTGRDSITDTILGMFAGRVTTTHTVTNPRVRVGGDTAGLTALVEAQHLLTADHSVHALLKNRYDVDLVRDGERWVVQRMVIENAWYTGDPAAIFGG